MANKILASVEKDGLKAVVFKPVFNGNECQDFAVSITLNGVEIDYREEFMSEDDAFAHAWEQVNTRLDGIDAPVQAYSTVMSHTALMLRQGREEAKIAKLAYSYGQSLQAVRQLEQWEEECVYLAGLIIGGSYDN